MPRNDRKRVRRIRAFVIQRDGLNCCYCNGSGERSWVDKVTRPYSKDFKYEVYLNQYHIETLSIRFSECIASYYNKQNS